MWVKTAVHQQARRAEQPTATLFLIQPTEDHMSDPELHSPETTIDMDIKVAECISKSDDSRYGHAVRKLVALAKDHLAIAERDERDEREIDEAWLKTLNASITRSDTLTYYCFDSGLNVCISTYGARSVWIDGRCLNRVTKRWQLLKLIEALKL